MMEYVSTDEAYAITKLVFATKVISSEEVGEKLGLYIDFEMGNYFITNQRVWFLAKIHYGI